MVKSNNKPLPFHFLWMFFKLNMLNIARKYYTEKDWLKAHKFF